MLTRVDQLTSITINPLSGRADVTITTTITDSADGSVTKRAWQITDVQSQAWFNAAPTQNYLAAAVAAANGAKIAGGPAITLAPVGA